MNSTCDYSASRTAEILSRYRPIAPKPEAAPNSSPLDGSSSSSPPSLSPTYLRDVCWPARRTRNRKRPCRTGISPAALKRTRLMNQPCRKSSPPAWNFVLHAHHQTLMMAALPFLHQSSPPSLPVLTDYQPVDSAYQKKEKGINAAPIDLNKEAEEVLLEKDNTSQMHELVAPRALRLVGSCICVKCINEDPVAPSPSGMEVVKEAEEVEEEMEKEALPAVVSDSKNKVRMANAAYKEMVGQPECGWLDLMVEGRRRPCSRISGEIVLVGVPVGNDNGFSGWAQIEWGSDGKKKSVHAFCTVMKVVCQSKDYLFAWKFQPNRSDDLHAY